MTVNVSKEGYSRLNRALYLRHTVCRNGQCSKDRFNSLGIQDWKAEELRFIFSLSALNERDWSGSNLSGATLEKENLSFGIFNCSTMERVRCSGSDLSDATFHWSSLKGSDLSLVRLLVLSLDETDMAGVDLRGALICENALRQTDKWDKALMKGAQIYREYTPENQDHKTILYEGSGFVTCSNPQILSIEESYKVIEDRMNELGMGMDKRGIVRPLPPQVQISTTPVFIKHTF